jgi:LacI family transcriptional regulator
LCPLHDRGAGGPDVETGVSPGCAAGDYDCVASVKPVTIMDVAREAGVSYATVSRVVNNKRSIVREKRARVLAAMQRLGYVPNLQARKLAGGRSQIVGLVLHDVWTSYAFEILRGIDAELAAAEYDLMLYTSRQRAATESAYVASLTQGLAEGLLLLLPRDLGAYIERLRQRHFPFVLVDHQGVAGEGPAVAATNYAGAFAATSYLLDLGHRRIGFITGNTQLGAAQDRLDGYRAALIARDLAPEPELVVEGDFFQPRAYQAASQLLSLADPPTAIFASNDVSAFGAIQAAADRGVRIPHDLSLVGFDDIPQAAFSQPALTTVRQPLEEMGRVAARLLLASMRDPDLAPTRIELPTELVVRASCAGPRATAPR